MSQHAVEISASPTRYVQAEGEHTREALAIALQVTHASVDTERERREGGGGAATRTLEILEASLLSRRWTLRDVVAGRNKHALAPHERAHLALRAHPLPASPSEGTVAASGLKISRSPEAAPDVAEPPYSKFVVDYATSISDDADADALERRRAPPGDGSIRSTLVVRWKMRYDSNGEQRSVVGQSFLWLDRFPSATASRKLGSSLPNEMSSLSFERTEGRGDALVGVEESREDDAIAFKMEHSIDVSHDFKRRRLCVVPVAIDFVNCYGVPVRAFMNLSSKRYDTETYIRI